MKALTTKERKRFEDLVEEGRNCYSAMALILKEIKDGRLYRETHETFEKFTQSTYKITRQRAYQLIEHAEITEEIANSLSTIVDKPALNESQTRELGKVDSDQRVEVLEAAFVKSEETGKPVTAATIKTAAKAIVDLDSEMNHQSDDEAFDSSSEYENVPEELEPDPPKPAIDQWKMDRNVIVKTLEKIQRMADELHEIKSSRWHHNVIREIQQATKTMRGWEK